MEQVDLFEDHRAALRRLTSQSVDRIGLGIVAHQLKQDPSTVSNKLARRDGRAPQDELVYVCLALDPEYRKAIAKVFGETLCPEPPEYVSPEDALRELAVHAKAGDFGNEGKRIVLDVYRRVKAPEAK